MRLSTIACLLMLVVGLGGCDDSSGQTADAAPIADATTDAGIDAGPDANYTDLQEIEGRLGATLDDLAGFGNKRAGTPEGEAAGDYVRDRFVAAGLDDVAFESFTFPRYVLGSTAMTVSVDGNPVTMAHDVFAYSGVGSVDATAVFVGSGQAAAYSSVDANGRVVIVERDQFFHREAQLREVVAHGGVAMLQVSGSPNNLIQIGTVSAPEDGLGPVPALTVGADDGQILIDAVQAGSEVRVVADVNATTEPATGRNVVGWLYGNDPSGGFFVVGAHYDTWYTGTIDNSTGVAAVLEIAEALTSFGPRRLGIAFVAYDAEEVGLFGGYDFLRDHVIVGGEPMLAFFNFEMPANGSIDDGLRGLGHTHGGSFDSAVVLMQTDLLYTTMAGLEIVPQLFGGSIPTDIQGMYRYGIQGLSTFCSTEWYHTVEDTPDKVDMPFFAEAVRHFELFLDTLDDDPLADLMVFDDSLWRLDVATSADATGDMVVDVTVTDAAGTPQLGADVQVWVDVDSFTRSHREGDLSDAAGQVSIVVPAPALTQGQGDRWLHVTAGRSYPLAETILPLP